MKEISLGAPHFQTPIKQRRYSADLPSFLAMKCSSGVRKLVTQKTVVSSWPGGGMLGSLDSNEVQKAKMNDAYFTAYGICERCRF